jgi:RNA polymerase sigma-70 factor (ECF subfamily)
VVRSYQDKVFRLCCAMLGDQGLAEETAQDIFLRVWKALPDYRGDSTLSTWIYAIARNACLTARKKAVHRGLSLENPGIRQAAERAVMSPAGPDRGPDIPRLLDELPAQYREVIVLFHMQEKSYEEVASMLGLPLGTVKTYLHRARKQLAEAVVAADRSTMTKKGAI